MTKSLLTQEKYVSIIAQINDTLELIKRARPIPTAAIKRFNEEMSILSSFNSNAIEGNTFTYDETRLLLKEGITASTRSMREHNDIFGYSKAYFKLYDALKTCKVIDEQFILQLHSLVLLGDETAGQYRKSEVFIGDSVNTTYIAPKAEQLTYLMQNYIKDLQKEMQENIKNMSDIYKVFLSLAKHHIEFERIHPFVDGNGRTGRLLLNFELLSIGLLPVDISIADRARYYSGFKTYEDKKSFSTREESKFETMAKLLLECELTSMNNWRQMFSGYLD